MPRWCGAAWEAVDIGAHHAGRAELRQVLADVGLGSGQHGLQRGIGVDDVASWRQPPSCWWRPRRAPGGCAPRPRPGAWYRQTRSRAGSAAAQRQHGVAGLILAFRADAVEVLPKLLQLLTRVAQGSAHAPWPYQQHQRACGPPPGPPRPRGEGGPSGRPPATPDASSAAASSRKRGIRFTSPAALQRGQQRGLDGHPSWILRPPARPRGSAGTARRPRPPAPAWAACARTYSPTPSRPRGSAWHCHHPVVITVLATVLDQAGPGPPGLERGPQVFEGLLRHVGCRHDVVRLADQLVDREAAGLDEVIVDAR